MEKIVPLISMGVAGPLGIVHLPRLWLKVLLHATGRLAEGYRHGAGGLDEPTLTRFGIDAAAFLAYVETERPSYMQCEGWIRAHATDLSEATVAEHNAYIRSRMKIPTMIPHQWRLTGLADRTARTSIEMNDLDDWACVHGQIVAGHIPPMIASSLNAEISELMAAFLTATGAARARLHVDLPQFGFTGTNVEADVKHRTRAADEGAAQTTADIHLGETRAAWIVVEDARDPVALDALAGRVRALLEEACGVPA